jgi:Mg-chelatase subunit ChlD
MKTSHFQKLTFPLVIAMSCVAGIIYATNGTNYMDTKALRKPPVKQGEMLADSLANRRIQVVFALDATGSMSGLIAAAKEKIWSIASSLSQTKDGVQIEMGLVFYRDRGDEFVTKQVQLSANLDDVYRELMSISANGGGDSPESVNQGLWEAIDKMSWTDGKDAYKAIFLVGDQPPHMDYQQDVPYTESCKRAQQKDIVINTILMGGDGSAKKIWQEIAACAQGSFFQMDMDVNNVEVSTPYDAQISKISDQLENERMYYGDADARKKQKDKVEKANYITANSSDEVKSRRAEYNISASGSTAFYGDKELVHDYEKGLVDLAKLKPEELPEKLRNKTLAEQKAILDLAVAQRKEYLTQLKALSAQRQEYLDKELGRMDVDKVENSFNNQVFKSVQQQAGAKSIQIEGKAKY